MAFSVLFVIFLFFWRSGVTMEEITIPLAFRIFAVCLCLRIPGFSWGLISLTWCSPETLRSSTHSEFPAGSANTFRGGQILGSGTNDSLKTGLGDGIVLPLCSHCPLCSYPVSEVSSLSYIQMNLVIQPWLQFLSLLTLEGTVRFSHGWPHLLPPVSALPLAPVQLRWHTLSLQGKVGSGWNKKVENPVWIIILIFLKNWCFPLPMLPLRDATYLPSLRHCKKHWKCSLRGDTKQKKQMENYSWGAQVVPQDNRQLSEAPNLTKFNWWIIMFNVAGRTN